MLMPLYAMHRHNAGALSAEETQRYLGFYAAFFAGMLVATLFNVRSYLR